MSKKSHLTEASAPQPPYESLYPDIDTLTKLPVKLPDSLDLTNTTSTTTSTTINSIKSSKSVDRPKPPAGKGPVVFLNPAYTPSEQYVQHLHYMKTSLQQNKYSNE